MNHSLTLYFADIWRARHFWWHLSQADLRTRFRRSFFGILWVILQPLALTGLISIVFSRLFHQPIAEYAPYILSGIVVWEYISGSSIGGSLSFVQADAYIKQIKHPLAIYTLRNSVTYLILFMIASTVLLAWSLIVLPQNFGWSWLALPTILPILLFTGWPLSTILAYIGVRFRDIPNVLALVLQAAWFVSPVYFKDSMFRTGGMSALIEYNPIYHLLQIVRAPLLSGQWPSVTNYLWCLATMLAFSLIAVLVGVRSERRVIFYL